MKLACVIVEDLQVAADFLGKCCDKCGLLDVRAHFPDVPQALEFLNKNMVDVLFLDVEMPGATGFDLLDNIAYHPRVILTTSKEEYAYNAFEYQVVDFLKKPFTYHRFLQAVEKLAPATPPEEAENSSHIYIRSDKKLVKIDYREILFVQSMGDYVKVVTETKTYVVHSTIKKLEGKFERPEFIRVHRAYLVNLTKIDDIRENDLFIKGIEVPISRDLKSGVIKKLNIL